MRDALEMIVDDRGEMVSGETVRLEEDLVINKVGVEGDLSVHHVLQLDLLLLLDLERMIK